MYALIFAILAVGVVRFALSVSGLPNNVVTFASMSAVILIGAVYFALTAATHWERLQAAFLLVLPYMVIEVAALGYTYLTTRQTIFHAEEYSLGFPIGAHLLGHFVGGLTWEPVTVFVIMEIAWLISRGLLAMDRK